MIQVKKPNLKIPKELQSQNSVVNKSQQMGKDEFMKLLLAEMSNQDPLEPKSNSQSIAQMAQFASLEQSENLNKNFLDFIKAQKMSGLTSSAHMIGKYIKAENGKDEIVGKVKSTMVDNGKVYCKVVDENGKEQKVSLDQIVALSEEEIVKKEYVKLSPEKETTA